MCKKSFLLTISVVLISFGINWAQPVMKFEKTSHDFGQVPEGTYPKTTFIFMNEGNEALMLTDVRAGCGCTAPSWSRDSILPGKTGKIDVVFNTNGYANRDFAKSVVVTSNYMEGGRNKQEVLYISGHVVGKDKGPLPYKFVVSESIINFGFIPHGKKAVKTFTLTNNGDSVVKISKVRLSCDECMTVTYTPEIIKPSESATFTVTYLSAVHEPRNFVENIQIFTNIPDNLAISITQKGIVLMGEALAKKPWKEHLKKVKAEEKAAQKKVKTITPAF